MLWGGFQRQVSEGRQEWRKPANPGRKSRESAGAIDSPELAILRPRLRYKGESPMPERSESHWMDVKPTLSQTWTVDEPRSAICVQSVDVHVSCSSHSDAQLAAFFIDPRAK